MDKEGINISKEKNNVIATLPGLRYSKDGLSIVVTMDSHMKKNGLYPIKIQVVYKRTQRFYPTGKDMSREDWKALEATKSKKLIIIRNDIKNSFERIEGTANLLINEGGFSFDALNMRLGASTTDTVNTAFKAKIKALETEGRAGTQMYYNSVLNSITGYKNEVIKFTDITPDWLRNYEKHLLKEGKTYTTVGIYMRAIRAILNTAIANGCLKANQYPFKKNENERNKYEIPQSEGRKLALNLQQIKSIFDYTDGREATERYRDLWLFSYLCNGINFYDILKLRWCNISGDKISFLRQKTIRTSKKKREIQAIITPEAQIIIDRWGNPDKKPENYVFPYLENNDQTPMQEKKKVLDITKRANRKLKEIGKAVGIEGLTTYSARHSYATVLKRSGSNIAFISESLGHRDLKTTEHYLASFEDEEMRKNAALLTKFDDDTE